MTNPTHQFTTAEVAKVVSIVTRRLSDIVPKLIAEAIEDVLNVSLSSAPTERTAARILKALRNAPKHAENHPDEARFMVCHSMTKTTLRRIVSNSAPNFNEALQSLVDSQAVKCVKAVSPKGRLLHVYGLPEQPRENPEH